MKFKITYHRRDGDFWARAKSISHENIVEVFFCKTSFQDAKEGLINKLTKELKDNQHNPASEIVEITTKEA